MEELTARLKERALEEGFDLVGVAASGEATGREHLNRWLEEGRHGDMAWMAETADLRHDPQRLLDGCKSILVVAMSYRTDRPASAVECSNNDDRVWISRYAWGRDYHKIMKRKLIRIGRWFQEQNPDQTWRACVDTAPILEREWAARAGLGWIGKNTSLLNRTLGSELFLGVLLTTAELVADAPATDHCGRCTACLEACPSGALPEPRRLDARRCIAYLTVEHRGPVDPMLQPLMGTMVAGCDICQEVCPWTVKAPTGLHPEFEPAEHRYRPELSELEKMDEAAYRDWRSGSALNRIPFDQFRRSLAIARRNFD